MASDDHALNQAAAIVGGIALVVLFSALTLAITPGPAALADWLKNGTAASWAQALISGCAIVAGAGAIFWQVRKQERDRVLAANREEIRRLQTVYFVFVQVRVRFVYVRNALQDGKDLAFHLKCAQHAIERVFDLPLLEVPTWATAYAVMDARTVYERFVLSRESEDVDEMSACIDKAIDQIIDYLQVIHSDIKMRGGRKPEAVFSIADEIHYS
jgi:hypothetical protein